MTTKTTYTCDLCKKEQDNYTQFWTVYVGLEHFPKRSNAVSSNLNIEVCRKCLEGLGFFETAISVKERKETGKEPSTTAEKLENLIQEMVDQSVEWTVSNY